MKASSVVKDCTTQHRQTEAEKKVRDYNNGLTILKDTGLSSADIGVGIII